MKDNNSITKNTNMMYIIDLIVFDESMFKSKNKRNKARAKRIKLKNKNLFLFTGDKYPSASNMINQVY